MTFKKINFLKIYSHNNYDLLFVYSYLVENKVKLYIITFFKLYFVYIDDRTFSKCI